MSDQDVLTLAQSRLEMSASYWSEENELALDDIRFRYGEQWPDAIKQQRARDNRPMLTVNRLPAFIKQVVNDQRQNRPAISVRPVDDKSDKRTAEMMQGLIRNIENVSAADQAYDTAFDYAVTSGRGFFRILTDYSDSYSFDQDIRIERIANPFSVYTDPADTSVDGSGMEWAFITEMMRKEEFEKLYPSAQTGDLSISSVGDYVNWGDNETVRIAEYFYCENKEQTLVLMENGGTMLATEYKELKTHGFKTSPVVRERQTIIKTVKWCKHTGSEILETKDWPSQWIPVIPVYGDEIYVDGKRRLISLIRYAKDPQRMYNFWLTAETESIALVPRAPFIGAVGQFENLENKWMMANHANLAYLEYNPVDVSGTVLPPPQRQAFAGPPSGILTAKQQNVDDIKAVMGIFDASLGQKSNETSGRAILARQREGDVATFHFVDNLSRSIRHAGRIIVDLLPKIYDTARMARILGEDGQTSSVMLRPGEPNQDQKIYDISAGKYDVVVNAGPSYSTKRDQAVEAMLEFIRVYPNAAPLLGDKLARNMDWPESEKIADRLKMMLPPQIQQSEQDDTGNPEVKAAQQQAKMQMDQAQQQIDQMHQALQEAGKQVDELTAQGKIKTGEVDIKQQELALKNKEFELKLLVEQHRIEESQARFSTEQQGDAQEAQVMAALPQLLQDIAQVNQAILASVQTINSKSDQALHAVSETNQAILGAVQGMPVRQPVSVIKTGTIKKNGDGSYSIAVAEQPQSIN